MVKSVVNPCLPSYEGASVAVREPSASSGALRHPHDANLMGHVSASPAPASQTRLPPSGNGARRVPCPVGNTRPTAFTMTAPGRSRVRLDGPVGPPAPAVERAGYPKPVVVSVAGVDPVAVRGAQVLQSAAPGPAAQHPPNTIPFPTIFHLLPHVPFHVVQPQLIRCLLPHRMTIKSHTTLGM